ncbi:GNAT family N-acetyltransferase [Alkaliphilus sp. B6464]|uniref:GNAT family N-acetyltransferase n=1 Tax=Alkaliphilus sp. B6464 TaxID=2731219 RepID=UPI001BAA85DE|nr:GNAT family protein [Alkaliphilus sp. B6464]QUH18591.1 GNAT family N-acetyltransferase [Alkaliphilus sp. B6464]
MINVLLGKSIYLKLVEREDLSKRVDWLNDTDIQRTLNYDYPTSIAKTEKWFDKVISDSHRRDFSVFLIEDNQYIGFCGLIDISYPVGKAELYITIGEKDTWGNGYGTEVYDVLMKYGFEELGLNKIYIHYLTYNQGTQKIMQKIGWQLEGLLRQDIYSHGKVADRYIASILKKDWAKKNEISK